MKLNTVSVNTRPQFGTQIDIDRQYSCDWWLVTYMRAISNLLSKRVSRVSYFVWYSDTFDTWIGKKKITDSAIGRFGFLLMNHLKYVRESLHWWRMESVVDVSSASCLLRQRVYSRSTNRLEIKPFGTRPPHLALK